MLRVSVVLNAMSPLRLASVLVGLSVAAGVSAEPLLSVGAGCSNCPLRIPDGGLNAPVPALVEAQLTVPSGGCAGNAAVGGIEITVSTPHGNIGDLRVRLRDPGGTYYTLVDRLASGGGAAGSCPGDDIGTMFLESAPGALGCSELIPATGLESKAAVSLAGFNGPVAAGAWAIEVGDGNIGGYGNLEYARLQFYCTAQRSLFRDGLED